jgi:DNA-binding response OmpR family regulator
MSPTPRALVAEDEPQMATIIAFALETQGFVVTKVHDGQAAMRVIDAGACDLAVLDVMLPAPDGLALCRHIRASSTLPVLLLTARTDPDDVIAGLEAGADDYVAKPFHPRELALRAVALTRRSAAGRTEPGAQIEFGDILVERSTHQVTVGGVVVPVTSNEFKLLCVLLSAPGIVCSWEQLLHDAWGVDAWDGGREMVKAAVYRLRHKLRDDPAAPKYIEAVRGVGYRTPAS